MAIVLHHLIIPISTQLKKITDCYNKKFDFLIAVYSSTPKHTVFICHLIKSVSNPPKTISLKITYLKNYINEASIFFFRTMFFVCL